MPASLARREIRNAVRWPRQASFLRIATTETFAMHPTPNHRITRMITGLRASARLTRLALASTVMLALAATSLLAWRSGAAARTPSLLTAAAPLPAAAIDITQPTIGPGLPQVGSNAPKSAASSLKAGSLLFFHKYTSDAVQPDSSNTLITLTNTNPRDGVTVHLFFVYDCAVSRKFINLAPNQARTLLMSKEKPGTTGYVVAIAVNAQGVPSQFNWLIGSATLRDAAGHEASYNALAVAKRTGGPVRLGAENPTAVTLRFDNSEYDRLPKTLAVDQLQNQDLAAEPAVTTDVTLYSPLADLSGAPAQPLQINATAYDQVGRPYPETVSANCAFSARVETIWTATPLNSFITPGNPGWATFAATNGVSAVPVLGLSLTDGASGPQRSARNMQTLAWLDSFTMTVPVSFPENPHADVITLDLPDATGGATGASENKAGSALLYSRFVSGAFGSTRINLTNTHASQKARVRVFFTGLANQPQVTETILSLLPNQTAALDPNDFAPNQRGWVLALVIDSRALPMAFNHLIGSAQVNEADGQVAAFNAIAFAKNSSGAVPRNDDVLTSDLLFDDVNYDRMPATVGLSAVPSQADNTTLLGYARPPASLLEAPNTRGAAALVLFDQALNSFGLTVGATEARLGTLRPSLLNPPITSTISKGQRGWLKLSSATPLFAWANNLRGEPFATGPEGTWTGGFSGGGNLHTLTTGDSLLLKTAAINPNNHAPTALAASIGVYVEARRANGTIVRLDASESSDPDPEDPLTYKWYDNEQMVSTARIGDLRLGLGTHIIKLMVTDGSGIPSAPEEQLVEVRDTTPPQLSGIPSNLSRVTGSQVGVTVNFPLPAAYDMVDGQVNVTASPAPGSLFKIGKTTVIFTAKDNAGNTATAKMDVTITKGTANLPQQGGIAGNIAPTMENINDQYIPPGETRNIPLQAADADGDLVSFSLISTTTSAQIVDVDLAARRATLRIALQPEDRVVNTIRVVATDSRGQSFTTLPFRVTTSEVPNDDTGSGGGTGGGDPGPGGGGGGTSNNPPVAAAAALPATVQATSKEGADVHLDGSPSSDPDGDPLTYSWKNGNTVIAEGAIAIIKLPVGVYSITLTVSDGKGGTSSTAPMSLEVLPRPLTAAGVSPAKIPQFNTTTLTITGTGFNPGTKVSFTGTGITIANYASIEEDKIVLTLKTTLTTPLGNRDVIISNPNGESVRLVRACYVAP
jgi:hypothetical protein